VRRAVLFLALLVPAPARADAPEPPPRVWYGWQTLIADAAAIGLGAATRSWPVFGSAYLAGGPLVHAAHGNFAVAAGSFALRLIAPLAFGGAGAAIDSSATGSCLTNGQPCFRGIGGLVIGAAIGYAVAVTVDALVLAREPEPRSPVGHEPRDHEEQRPQRPE
jgi:hypothetical protein